MNPENMKENSALSLDQQFVASLMDDLANNRVTLPSLPDLALRVRKLVSDTGSTATQLVRVINADPVVAARLLKMVNTPAYRGRNPISSVRTAVTRLGNDRVRNLVYVLVLQQIYHVEGIASPVKQRLKDLWAHSTHVAALAQALAARYTQLDSDQALLSGLVHDIGKLPVLARAQHSAELLASPEVLDRLLVRLHTMVGPLILEAWGMADELITVAREHENLWRQEGLKATYVDVVIVANLHSHLGTPRHDIHVDWNTIPAFQRLGLTPEESLAAMTAAREELLAVRNLLMG